MNPTDNPRQPQTAEGPFHPGEQAVQERLGVREQIEPWARRVVRPSMPDEHRTFYAGLPFVVAAARDGDGRPWATLLAGTPGFISTPDARSLQLDAQIPAGDALEDALAAGEDLGLLGIELATRRRNRVNGRINARDGGRLLVQVDQSFGNCPQYIHPREWIPAPDESNVSARRADQLSEADRDWIGAADTFFIASGHRAVGEAAYYGMDASHRGGEPGFVTVLDERTLRFPDYTGNNHFNTLGNLSVDPLVGVTFVDFERGSLLQLTGIATIDWDSAVVAATPGAQRLVTIDIKEIVVLDEVLPIRWKSGGEALRLLRIAAKRRESADVTSFVLEARDGGTLPDFEPGQHLPLEVVVPGRPDRLLRTYSLSAAPSGQSYRVSVKREPTGEVSRYLHDEVSTGDLLSARLPSGEFVLKPGARPVVLVSAGVGVTPMLSILESLAAPAEAREVWFVHGVRDGAHHPLAEEARTLAGAHERLHRQVHYSRPRPEDQLGRDYDRTGRVTAAALVEQLPTLDADFYLCGPLGFMSELMDDLVALGVSMDQIHAETFGPLG